MNKLFVIISLFAFFTGAAQVKKVKLQASGLTCSMCSNAISKSLRTIPYINNVKPDISTSTFEITFNSDAAVNFDAIRQKVESAGFFVAGFEAIVHVEGLGVKNDTHANVAGMVFHFLNVKDEALNGDISVKLLDKGYVTAKQFKKGESLTRMGCYRSGVAGPCCSSFGLAPGTRIYHVTII